MKNRWKVVLLSLASLFLLTAQDCSTERQKQSQARLNHVDTIMTRQPSPEIEFSMDRYLLSQRLTRMNDPNRMSYLYVVLSDGTWLKVTIVGKLASTSKRLNNPEEYSTQVGGMPAPDEMGTYGSSDPAKLGMSTLGSLIEFGGYLSYIYSETPLNFQGKQVTELTVVATPEEKQHFLKQLTALKEASRK